MISMTGYGFAERLDEQLNATVEVKSVNNRYLDVNVTLPGSLGPLEPQVRESVSKHAARGRVDVFIRLRELQEDLEVYVDRSALGGYLRALEELRDVAGIDEPVSVDHVLRFDGVIKSERRQDRDRYWETIGPLLERALEGFVESRTREGEELERDIMGQLARVEAAVEAVAGHEQEIERQVRGNLSDRFRDVVGDAVEESRMLAEVAVQLTRFSINEEIVRLRAHLTGFRTTAKGSGAVGKKLDFLCQEMHREINTIGSKSVVLAISEQVVEAKDALENVREQLRNVE
ncbi:MAG: YicC/YloC family endoribonuclease [Spirochaetota bacterium]